jgi:glycosyltransferase involved in cell wall biosynthesis
LFVMKGRVLYTAFDVVPRPKGASTHILHFLRALVNGGYQVHLVTPGDGQLPTEDRLEGARVTRLAPLEEGNYLAQATNFGEAVIDLMTQEAPYDFVHYRSIWSGLKLAQAKSRYNYKTIFEVNGLPSIELKYHYPGIEQGQILEKIRQHELATIVLSDALVCVSEVSRTFLTSLGAPQKRITVIPNGASPKNFPAKPPLSLENELPTILYIGTLADWQGLETLLKAMPLINAEHPARIKIVGRGRSRQRKAVRKQIRKLGLEAHVCLLDPLPHHEIPALIAQADLCVAPLGLNDRNIVQGCCPIKVLEYMAAGRPILASNLPVVRELVREGVDGLLFWPDDPDDLARNALRLLRDPQFAQCLADNAAQRARQNFTWHIAGKNLLKLYRRLARRPAQTR